MEFENTFKVHGTIQAQNQVMTLLKQVLKPAISRRQVGPNWFWAKVINALTEVTDNTSKHFMG